MQRNLICLTSREYDVVIIGGGIYGACIAWDATLRGLAVALVDKGDFGHATSANSLKTIHGGLRYLQQLDLKRMRESIRERTTLMRIAPHLVHPLPCVMPTYGHAMKGREVMAAALLINDLISFDRNQLADTQKHLPPGRLLSAQACLNVLPGIPAAGLTGGALWYDGQVYNSERLTLAFVVSAAQAGAAVANYTEVVGFLRRGERIIGVQVKDRLTDQDYEIRAASVINAAGPWVDHVLGLLNGSGVQLGIRLAKATNLVTRPVFTKYAVGLAGRPAKATPKPYVSQRLLFVSPWRKRSLLGTSYTPFEDHPDTLHATADDMTPLLDAFNLAYPAASLAPQDIAYTHYGLVPAGVNRTTGAVQRATQYQLTDHRQAGLKGLLSVLGVKYTTARDVAAKVVDRVFAMQGLTPPPVRSTVTPLYGGQIENFDQFMQTAIRQRPFGLGEDLVRPLIYNYGAAYTDVLRYFEPCLDAAPPLSAEQALLKAQIRHAIHHEMAQTLSDIIFRRTELGTAGRPDPAILDFCASVMRCELSWSQRRVEQEIQAVNDRYVGCA